MWWRNFVTNLEAPVREVSTFAGGEISPPQNFTRFFLDPTKKLHTKLRQQLHTKLRQQTSQISPPKTSPNFSAQKLHQQLHQHLCHTQLVTRCFVPLEYTGFVCTYASSLLRWPQEAPRWPQDDPTRTRVRARARGSAHVYVYIHARLIPPVHSESTISITLIVCG